MLVFHQRIEQDVPDLSSTLTLRRPGLDRPRRGHRPAFPPFIGPRRGSVQDPEREVLAWDPVVLDRGPRARQRYGRLPATA